MRVPACISCDRTKALREEIATERSDHHAEPLNQSASNGPARQPCDHDPAQVEQAGGDDKAGAVIGGCEFGSSARKFAPVSVKDREHGDATIAATAANGKLEAPRDRHAPRTRADSAITTSGIGRGMRSTPRTPPIAITSLGNVIGPTKPPAPQAARPRSRLRPSQSNDPRSADAAGRWREPRSRQALDANTGFAPARATSAQSRARKYAGGPFGRFLSWGGRPRKKRRPKNQNIDTDPIA